MSTITLPKLILRIWSKTGNKNSIDNLIDNSKEIIPILVNSSRNHILLEAGGEKYFFTSNKNNIPEVHNYVLQTNRKPTLEGLISKEIKIKKWLKHPKNKVKSNSQIINSWKNNFLFKEENIEKKENGLRIPQISALYAVLSHLKVSYKSGIVVMPTGTGKTETMLSVLIANRCPKLIVTVPSDALRTQIFDKFLNLGLLKEFGIIGDKSLYPKVGILKQKFDSLDELEDYFNNCNVIVTTMNIVANSSIKHQTKISELCSHLFIDEAHHVKATSWDLFRKRFDEEKVLMFTATPFRNDQKRLDGKIIFNFSLSKAQEQGYFKKIDFLPIREYDFDKADKLIAEKAVLRLREDISKGHNHIMMARCGTKNRAEFVYEIYKEHSDLYPVIIYSGITNKKEILENILSKKHKIIIAVDMLGEGFDLPELKIAAFHDIRKSLPVTLQLAGRFTRTKYDEQLGNAAFVVNIADVNVKNELSELYAQDADWNLLLSSLSSGEIDDEIAYEEFISGFKKLNEATIALQNIRTPLSAVVYKNHTKSWFPNNFKQGMPNFDENDYRFYDINKEKKVLVIVTAQKNNVEWGNFKEIYELNWSVSIIFWESKNNLLFIYSSDKSMNKDIAEALIGKDAELINEINVFRSFAGLKRVSLQNVGLKEFLGKNIRFRMSVGTDVEQALSIAEKERGQKAFVFGVGYENGEKVSLGCSYKGRIWSKLRGGLKEYTEWCKEIGDKLTDESIDPNQVLKETLMPKEISVRPVGIFPVWIDWHEEMYNHSEMKYTFKINDVNYNLSNCELKLSNPSDNGPLLFKIATIDKNIEFVLELSEKIINENTICDYKIKKTSIENVIVEYGNKVVGIENFLYEYIPTIWFADGSALTGNYYVELKQMIKPFSEDKIIPWNWSGVDTSKEAQGVDPKIPNSVQFKVINELMKDDFDIIYDDDYSGEIADVIAIKQYPDKLKVNFYHLKFAKKGKVNNSIDNFYEVCGQAQKSIHWKHRNGSEFFDHLLRRETKRRKGKECSRIEKGTRSDLIKLLGIAKKRITMEFEVFIVQPSLSKAKASTNILTVLGVTENYLKELADINLKVIASS
ncbi:DEAD/DEAH box helicase [Lutibacter flavus]|uniref:Superfamily II DNA or RNA helicase n=1 Tax=Lutibacter flavus TaxID=691689 RepID=A0A238VM00_9FLAO|nr:DEAD/DEAH box helicase family protein [Lutibacter flavus]SNR35218.1 Superfamily II DNA or RNA helicase [Lutibacter flavus]